LPIKYSSGFHPAPRISFGDALPLGVSSEAELIDLELTEPCAPQEVFESLVHELPEGVNIIKAENWLRGNDAPANSVFAATYKVPLTEELKAGLEQRLADFLKQDSVITKRAKKKGTADIDLRPWVFDLRLQDNLLWMKMHSGSPLFLAAYLLGQDVEHVRSLGICKTAVDLKKPGTQVD